MKINEKSPSELQLEGAKFPSVIIKIKSVNDKVTKKTQLSILTRIFVAEGCLTFDQIVEQTGLPRAAVTRQLKRLALWGAVRETDRGVFIFGDAVERGPNE